MTMLIAVAQTMLVIITKSHRQVVQVRAPLNSCSYIDHSILNGPARRLPGLPNRVVVGVMNVAVK